MPIKETAKENPFASVKRLGFFSSCAFNFNKFDKKRTLKYFKRGNDYVIVLHYSTSHMVPFQNKSFPALEVTHCNH